VNFFEGSSRVCTPRVARDIVEAVASRVPVYGVFVRASREQIEATMVQTGITGVQLHGGEPAELARGWKVPVIRAIAVTDAEAVRAAFATRGEARILLDSPRGGGSGMRFDEALLESIALSDAVVAGGLDPTNVAAVVGRLRPFGVDTAGGVETSAGVKDSNLVREFIENARSA
jgi:phosphoribosylanthranilate isomerase